LQEKLNLLDSFIGEGQGSVVIVGAVDPDNAILGLETDGQLTDEVFVDAEVFGDAPEGVHVVDLVAVARWAATSPGPPGGQVTGLILFGDSAGGALAVVTSVAFRKRPAAAPVLAQALMYPVTDLGRRRASHERFAPGYMLTLADLHWFYDMYAAEAAHWRASPLLADQQHMPPTLVATCGLDPLRDKGRAYAAATAQAGVPTVFLEADGMIHGFLSFRRAIPSAAVDLDRSIRALKVLLDLEQRARPAAAQGT